MLLQSSCLLPQSFGAIALSRGLAELPGLGVLLGCTIDSRVSLLRRREKRVVLAWGRRPSATKAEGYAMRHSLPIWRLEDGFVRSMGLGETDPPFSIVVDDVGIHYDASTPSRIELLAVQPLSPGEIRRTHRLIESWRQWRVSKYNLSPEFRGELPSDFVLVVDQSAGDLSIHCGQANRESFRRMLAAAIDENPTLPIVLKVHPNVIAGFKQGNFDIEAIAKHPRVFLLGENAHPPGILERASAVYTVTSQMGFEALLWGKRVRTFGLPFYAGWGLTEDELPAPERRTKLPLENLVHAALVRYARYRDPESGHRCDAERVITWIGKRRQQLQAEAAGDFSI